MTPLIVKNGTYTDNLKILVNSPEKYKTRYKASFTSDDGEYRSKVFNTENEANSWLADNTYASDNWNIEEIKELIKDSW